MLSYGLTVLRTRIMPDGLIFSLIFVAVVIVYTVARVFKLLRQSDRQWRQVDKSKLKSWDDDEEW
jgi:hypothetical protein